MGYGMSISFLLGNECEIYLSCFNVFLQFLHYRLRITDLEKLLYLCYLVVPLREVTIHLKNRVWNLVFQKNQKGIFAMWVWLKRKWWKWAETMEKSIPKLKAEFMWMCERKKKFWNSCDYFKLYKKSHSKRILNLQNFLPKHHFSSTLETVL